MTLSTLYKQAYNLAIQLHIDAESKLELPEDAKTKLKKIGRDIVGHIANSCHSSNTLKGKRFYLFKALDSSKCLAIDIDFLSDKMLNINGDCLRRHYDAVIALSKKIHKFNTKLLEDSGQFVSKSAKEFRD